MSIRLLVAARGLKSWRAAGFMPANQPARRGLTPPLAHEALTTLLAGTVLLALCFSAVHARAPGNAGTNSVRRGEELLRADLLLDAEKAFRSALPTAEGEARLICYDALLVIYTRLNRFDQAVRTGLAFRDWLERGGGARWADSRRARGVALAVGASYLALGHHLLAEPFLKEALNGGDARSRLPPPQRLEALTQLALVAQRRGDKKWAEAAWRDVEEAALAFLSGPREDLKTVERIRCVWKLADSYDFQKRPDKAISQLQRLLPEHDAIGDAIGKRDTLRMLARHQIARRDYRGAADSLQAAVKVHERADPGDRLVWGDLFNEMANAEALQGLHAESERSRAQAAVHYTAVLKSRAQDGNQNVVGRVLSAFWRLQLLYQKSDQYRKALQLTEAQATSWGDGQLIRSKLQAEQGSLHSLLGTYATARDLLREALADLERQDPLNLADLARALNGLAVVEQATGGIDNSESLARRTLDLYRRYQLPDDLFLIEAVTLLGSSAALRGQYAPAVTHFQEGIARCAALGAAGDRPRCNLLLNIALLHKSQNDLPAALAACLEALEVYKKFAVPDAIGYAGFYGALATMHAMEGRLAESFALTDRILELCRKYQVTGGPLIETAKHCRALYFLAEGETAPAEKLWQEVLTQQQAERQSIMLPRTLNYLGLAAEVQGRTGAAEEHYRRALELQERQTRTFPATHYISCWRLADLADRGGRRDESRQLLEKAVTLVEAARLRTYGDAEQRAGYFAQFAGGFEELVRRAVRDGRIADAIAQSARGRSRTLLDQLQSAGIDPRRELHGPRGEELRRREAELRQRISAIRARAQLLTLDVANEEQGRRLVAELEAAQLDYTNVWREVVNNSNVFRGLTAYESPARLLESVRRALGPQRVLLAYHIGSQCSYLFLIGTDGKAEVFPLTVPASLAALLEQPAAANAGRSGTRGLVLKPARPATPPTDPGVPLPATSTPAAGQDAPARALTHAVAVKLVDHCLRQLTDPEAGGTRGLRLVAHAGGDSKPLTEMEALTRVLLPAAALTRLHEQAPEAVVVVPDGPVHKLPLEALVLEARPARRYVLDELPPLLYVPSVMALALFADRPRSPTASPLSLLTVDNPAYPQAPAAPAPTGTAKSTRAVLALRGQLPLLPATVEESHRLRSYFDPQFVTALESEQATEKAVVAAIKGKRVVHLAAHGFADDHFGNLFGAIALTPPPPGKETSDNDGFLSLHEIYQLPLHDCELAVLSACSTNVGPQRPLEAGVTLASGFLAAGARQVVASHWSVDDRSTSELIAAFFEKVTEDRRRGHAHYALALHNAKKAIRGRPEFANPFFWAPFVLIGSAGRE